ncbi:15417_t:CDS:2, partial [Gigaspora margarita]
HPKEKIWDYYISSNVNSNHSATCHYCPKYWSYGCPAEMEAHLANICPDVSKTIKEHWQKFLSDKITNYKRAKSSNENLSKQHDLSSYKQNKIDQAILKAWIITDASFDIISNPFMIDLFKHLNSIYMPPGHITLSNRLLEQETAQINLKIDAELERHNFLILALDGWSSPNGDLIYNYSFNYRPARISYLTDEGSNVRVAQQIISQKYLHILNIQCAAYLLNLIATDLIKLKLIGNLISQSSEIIGFFNRNHHANAILKEGLSNLQIKGGDLKMYSKTQWCSLWNTIDSLLHTRPIFEWIKCKHPNILTNKNTAINIVESKTETMADCYIEYIKLAIAINWIPQKNVLKNNAVSIFNRRYKEFDHDAYLLGYFLHPGCHGLGLKKGTFRRIYPFDMEYKKESETSLNWWLTFEDEDEESPLIKLAIKLFLIMPSQAGDSVNSAIISDINELLFYSNEDLPSDNQEYSLSDNQEHLLLNDHEYSQSTNSSVE